MKIEKENHIQEHRDNRTLRVMAVHGAGLGYENWIELSDHGVCDLLYVGMMNRERPMAVCHPAITATQKHADAIEGVHVGRIICGVRWWTPISYMEGHTPKTAANKD